MAVFWMVVVAWPVQIRRHGADEVASVLVPVGVAQLQPSNFGDGVRFIRGLELTREQGVFAHGLRGVFGVNARAPQEQKLVHPGHSSRLDDVRFHHQVVIQEFGTVGVVGVNAPHFGGSEVNVFGPCRHHEFPNLVLIPQVQFVGRPQDEVGGAGLFERPNDGTPHHATVSRHKNGLVEFWVRHETKV